MAKNDIRLDINFCDHPKTKRLIRTLGHEAFFSLVKLWTNAARLYPKGHLKDLDEIDIADLAGWSGDPEEFVTALTDSRINFLENVDGQYYIHDWEENQPWIYYQEERSAKAKKAARKRWAEDDECEEQTGSTEDEDARSEYEHTSSNANPNKTHAGSNASIKDTNAPSNAGSMQVAYNEQCDMYAQNAPSPSPSPTPIPIPTPIPKNSGEFENSPPSEDDPLPPAAKNPGKTTDSELHASIQKAFLSKNGDRFTDYGKEGKAIKQLIAKAKARDPDNHQDFIKAMITRFWELKTGGRDKFWNSQPFLPSALNAGGIFDRVLETFRDESSGGNAPPGELDAEFLELIRKAEERREGAA